MHDDKAAPPLSTVTADWPFILARHITGKDSPDPAEVDVAKRTVGVALKCGDNISELAQSFVRVLDEICVSQRLGHVPNSFAVRSMTCLLYAISKTVIETKDLTKGDDTDEQQKAKIKAALGKFEEVNELANAAIAYAMARGWCSLGTNGFRITATGRTEMTGTSAATRKGWRVTGLPEGLIKLASELENLGGEAEAYTLFIKTGRQPSDTYGKYPKWNWWIKEHIKRPRHGLFRLE